MDVSIDFAGLKLKNPILTASGTFGFGLEFKRFGDLESLGGIVVKGLSLKPREGNPMPRIAETPCGMLNAIGIQNPGVEEFINKKLPKLPWKTLPVLANLYATDAAEFGELAGVLAGEEGVAALEVNVSCPNVKEGGIAFGQDPRQITKVAEAVKKNAGNKPVIIKLSPNVTDITVCAKAAEDGGADGLSLINTLSGMAVDIERRTPRLANVIGGLSGPAVKPVALRCVYQAVNAVKIPVMGLGGITTAEDAAEFLLVGAKAVQIGTGNFLSPDTAFKVAEELSKVLERVKAESIDEFIGSLQLPK
ncbi:dihydroorotate dehydrogenase [Desulfovibrio sp. JC022]|uniref:dihydroorotate dehydrogenase n=1 Tax=Desulfovibrio sp. JC022 TaxID=2593642 RepID=UPI0013D79CC5|nr:dihydroorotate dehydrogenase [Desulfovibrio sp. JC022]NDV23668.1 dihydroorotate dehydrogenase [Desulfovibrio sp. JC022]